MARFQGMTEGQGRTAATRLGSAGSGVRTHAAGWSGRVEVQAYADEETDRARVRLAPHMHSGGHSWHLATVRLEAYRNPAPEVLAGAAALVERLRDEARQVEAEAEAQAGAALTAAAQAVARLESAQALEDQRTAAGCDPRPEYVADRARLARERRTADRLARKAARRASRAAGALDLATRRARKAAEAADKAARDMRAARRTLADARGAAGDADAIARRLDNAAAAELAGCAQALADTLAGDTPAGNL